MRIAVVAPEVAPFSKTGGLADVCGALPGEFARAGHEVIVVSPGYRCVRQHAVDATPHAVRGAKLLRSGIHWFLEHESYDRDGLYGTAQGAYADNAARFALLCRGALDLLKALDWRPDVVHVHDWQASLVPIYMRTIEAEAFADVPSVITVHNLAYQGVFWHLDMPLFGLDWSLYNWKQLECHGKVNLLKGGIVFADAVTTVSPTYAKEIQTPEQGHRLDAVLRERAGALHGILNGVDIATWDPWSDPHIAANYTSRDLEPKRRCKAALQKRSGLPESDVPLFGFVGRLAEQKGIDLLVEAAEYMVHLPLQAVILASGEERYEEPMRRLAQLYPEKFAIEIAFDEPTAHRIMAGADWLLQPSKYEPCGLTQMYALRYGTPPIVRRTGGLADTVEDRKTGLLFEDYSPEALLGAVEWAVAFYSDPETYGRLQREGMKRDFSWGASAAKYLALFEGLRGGT